VDVNACLLAQEPDIIGQPRIVLRRLMFFDTVSSKV